ncbi:MAG: hypothetical protein M5R41_03490 [Bacteroidia bacterium]|nr:hypothetical protein [Bacteroidia bacterium]
MVSFGRQAEALKRKEALLFQRWGGERPTDGLVSPEYYVRSKPRVVFLMKETNGKVDLTDFLRNGGRWQTWNNVVRWSRLLRNGFAVPLRKITDEDRRNELLHLAIVNIKKTPGGARASKSELRHAVMHDYGLLRDQLELYQPDVIVCCGQDVTDLLPEIIDVRPANDAQKILHLSWSDTSSKGVAIPFYHPACRRNKVALLNELKHLVETNKLIKLWR